MKFWNTTEEQLRKGKSLVLLHVLDSEGSSPGRRGFKMLVGQAHWMLDSIGGGFMEHKLVELARNLLDKGRFAPFSKRQIHRTNEANDRSGMICSGEQFVSFYYLDQSDLELISTLNKSISAQASPLLSFSEKGLELIAGNSNQKQFESQILTTEQWRLVENICYRPQLYIIGAGHVSLALSKLMHELGFHIRLLDDRAGLNTMLQNQYVDEKTIIDYENIDQYIPDEKVYVALMSFGYRTDKLIIQKLVNKEFVYFGVLGSQAKMNKLFEELRTEGIEEKLINKVYSPIGLSIFSRSPMEIAVSIAAEIIKVKNG